MAVFRATKNGDSRISAPQPNSLFMALSSSELWTFGIETSARPTQRQLAIYSLLARARYARDEMESLYWSLAEIAAQAHALRDIEAVDVASRIMLALPVSPERMNVARYYQAFYLNRKGEFETARETADQLLDEGLTSRLRSRILLIKASTYSFAGEIEKSLPFYLEAGQIARNCDPSALVTSLRMGAVIKGIHGDHDEAAADLESLVADAWRMAKQDPEGYAATLNSYAVELGQMGHVEQALNVASRTAPLAFIHPEFNVTIAELRSKLPTRKHSVVVIHRPAEPIAARQAEPNRSRERVKPLAFIIREAERRFTSLRAPPACRVRLTPIVAVINPARQPTKPRAP